MNIQRILYILAALPLVWLAGCDKNDELPVDTTSQEIVFDMLFADDDPSTTKVATATDFTSSWETGDKVGVYIVKGNGGLKASGNWVDNMALTYGGGAWTASTSLYYPNDGDKLSFYAYYPYDAGMTNPNAYAFNVPIDQASNSGEYYKKNDFLWAKLENVSKSDNSVVLPFSHALAMIQIAIYDNESTPPAVNLLNVITDCTINLADQSITPGSTKNTIQMWRRHTINLTFFRWALVPPQTMDIRFVWTKNSRNYTVTPATNVTLTSGNIKKYTTTQP
ncbi:MAG TPA: hypothetical protein DDW85_06270 [Porphyromonadaceae bacterium]|nr:hypothetical protein [Porphyromonadaceae bacterium]